MKQRIVKLIAALCYWMGVDALFYMLNRKAKRIVTFHNVMPEHLLPEGKKIGLTDTEESFRMKVRILKEYFSISTDVLDNCSATITFDDGYKNQQEVAERILKEEGSLPAIIFAAGRMIDNINPSEALVVDLLLHWTHLAPNGIYKLGCSCAVVKQFEMTMANRQQVWQDVIWPSFCKDGETRGRQLLADLDGQHAIMNVFDLCNPEYLRLRMTGISNNDIRDLQSKGWLIGWHTQEHYPLSKLNNEKKKHEITDSPEGMKDVVFSYPYGELDSVDEECVQIAKAAGYPCAVSNVDAHSLLMGKYFMPRMMLDGNFYQCHMELSGLKYFLKTRKLLPKIN